MPADYNYVSSWECRVSDKQSKWQQILKRRVCNRANRNGSVIFCKVFVTHRWALGWSEWREWSIFWTNAVKTSCWKIIWLFEILCFRHRMPWRIIRSSKRFYSFPTSRRRPCKWERGGRECLRTQVSIWLIPVSVSCAFCKSGAVFWLSDVVRSSGVLRVKTVNWKFESCNVSWISFCISIQSSLSKRHDGYGICNFWFGRKSFDHAKPPRLFQGSEK